MRVVHYIPSIDRKSGGVGAYMQLLAKELGKLCDLHIVTHRSAHELPLENCKVHYIPSWWLPAIKAKREFMRVLQEVQPDVFHTNCCWSPLSSFTLEWAKSAELPCVYSPHGMLDPWILQRHHWTRKVPALMLYQKKSIQRANVLHATAESERQHLLDLDYNSHVTVIPNGVDLSTIPIVDKEKFYHSEHQRTILFLSRIHVKKGINFLIEAVGRLKNELKGSRILIAGEGDQEYIRSLEQLAENRGVDNMIHFVGGIYGDDKWKLYSEADLFVLPTHSENFGIVVAEALACGVPVITTKGTPWQELESHHCGWWTEVGTDATVQALREFLQCTPDDLINMGRNGRKLVEEEYSTLTIAKQMLEMYSKLKS